MHLSNYVLKCSFLVLFLLCQSNAHRILAVYTFPSRSHHVVFNTLTNELARLGHDIVVITSHPQKMDLDNIKEIEVTKVLELWIEVITNNTAQFKLKRGVQFTADMLGSAPGELMVEMADAVLSNPEVKELINDKTQKFDLVIAEAMCDFPLVFTEIFDAPFIWFSSSPGLANNFKTIGAPASHPFLFPSLYRNRINNLTVMEKIYELYIEANLVYHAWKAEINEDALIRKHFGEEMPNLGQLKDRVDMLFVNTNPIFAENRPVASNVVFLGGFHLEPIRELPRDLEEYVDRSKSGVVYISFGTNVQPSKMDLDLKESFIEAIETLPYNFLWKFDGDLPRTPSNLRIAKWWPQRDLLNHPNVKAFITQAGLQSTDEAIDSAVPLIGLPMMADQYFNAARYETLGIGINIDVAVMTTEDVIKAVRNVVEDTSYKENISKLRDRIRDQPQRPLERAVWWTEHVLRHHGARHLRSPQANISWTEYLVIDVFLVLLIGVLLVCFSILWFCMFVRRLVRCSFKVKTN